MLLSSSAAAVRFSTPDSLEKYVAGTPFEKSEITHSAALEEAFFLGLRLNRGVNLRAISQEFGQQALESVRANIAEQESLGLLERVGESIRLGSRGRLLSNEVFQSFLSLTAVPATR